MPNIHRQLDAIHAHQGRYLTGCGYHAAGCEDSHELHLVRIVEVQHPKRNCLGQCQYIVGKGTQTSDDSFKLYYGCWIAIVIQGKRFQDKKEWLVQRTAQRKDLRAVESSTTSETSLTRYHNQVRIQSGYSGPRG